MFAKKNVVAAAALTLVAVAAQAQVTVYGNVDVSVGRKQTLDLASPPVNGKLAKLSTTNVDSSDMSDSFIGFKGQEDLGGGLKAVFKLESGLALDTGAAEGGGQFWNRNATVGLAGDFGAVNLGRFESLFRVEGAAFNPFGYSRTFSTTSALLGTNGDFWSNGISYTSPNLGGLTLSAQHAAKEQAKGSAITYSAGGTAVGANFGAGPLALSAVYGDLREMNVLPATTGPAARDRAWLLGASYDFSVVKLFAQYEQDVADTKTSTAESKTRFFQIGAAVPVSTSGAVLLSYGQIKDTADNVVGSNKQRDFSLGYTHAVSKRTSAYAAWINERLKVSQFIAPDSISGTTNSFAVGVRHSF